MFAQLALIRLNFDPLWEPLVKFLFPRKVDYFEASLFLAILLPFRLSSVHFTIMNHGCLLMCMVHVTLKANITLLVG